MVGVLVQTVEAWHNRRGKLVFEEANPDAEH
jgi:hypothetical protein